MNNEIKEIIDKLNEDKDYDDYVDYKGSYFKPLLDYIINLQEENERLKEELQQEKKDFKEANDYCFELKDYKQKNEKAIEYINTHYLNANEPELLNILLGEDE